VATIKKVVATIKKVVATIKKVVATIKTSIKEAHLIPQTLNIRKKSITIKLLSNQSSNTTTTMEAMSLITGSHQQDMCQR